MAATLSVSLSLDPKHNNWCYLYPNTTHFKPHQALPVYLHKPDRHTFKSFFSHSHSHSSSSPSPTVPNSYLEDPLRTGRFLSNQELEKLKFLENFGYFQELTTGSMWVRVMMPEEMDGTVGLLAESFVESMLLPAGYVSLLKFLVKQYLVERRAVMPHAVTLIGFYRGEEEEEELAGTVEVCFDKMGASTSPPTPTPPKNSPYVCNMTVKKQLRRRGIGWHLLKASEELISQMNSSKEVYLHCRMVDAAPFSMYKKAGYEVVKTDSILVYLLLQRRKHLMCKKLPVLKKPSELYLSNTEEERPL
ncbi:hypothetical protein HS088_TW10G00046 [Tripterygium wilfordii]|uniref:N-acetyltransferase domain-containing protein n=1 Tax=Tripterygium wilfordii TaxID=458696 RepID=A0A7J7D405_TRIWF|nr:uncharacterized protein LOC120008103 [Tripterygium wilfordii]XP_038714548.1 uncharacterized protein LOC120008103 [Tripterygium wilfordii]KAF5741051.1 hypothetical protein HS088_TW10G00046 [Tripterygium wilfordii]